MLWLLLIILAYLIFAVAWLVDKHLLAGPIADHRLYTFYIGILGILMLGLAPFVGFYIPSSSQLVLSVATGVIFIVAVYWFYKVLHSFEASRVIPAIWGLTPLFTLGLVYIFSLGRETLSISDGLAFALLVAGSVMITSKNLRDISLKNLIISAPPAFFLALFLVFTKYVYEGQSFWNGFIWIRLGGVLGALALLLFIKELRGKVLGGGGSLFKRLNSKAAFVFLANQILGGSAAILQNLAIFLAPIAFLAIINALQGVQYVFLLLLSVLFSVKFPKILKEEISKEIIFQKIIAIAITATGLIILALK